MLHGIDRAPAHIAGAEVLAGRRLHRRCVRKTEHFPAFTAIACGLICYRRLAK
ncbi:hypothetical protein [Streptomyces sp. YIM B13518]|uniref:hypothetical protein n=1 Tax=Streptomyces sp. YIM B13518 TaxID=3366316 RepID=UPI0036DC4530